MRHIQPEQNLLPTATPPQKKWKKLYQCKRTKGLHDFTISKATTEYHYSVEGKSLGSTFWDWSMGLHDWTNKWKTKYSGLGHYYFSRSRFLSCDACGHKIHEEDTSKNQDGPWEPDAYTKRTWKKYENF